MSKKVLFPHVPKKKEPLFPHTVATNKGVIKFKPGEVVLYQSERVRVSEQIGDRVNIFIPSRQELVWVKPEKLERIEAALTQTAQAMVEFHAKTETDPKGRVTKFCCRFGDWCAPPELLGEGRFLDRIAALRQHYKEKHPGLWGKKLPE